MRYVRSVTRHFWEVGYRLFKGKFLRFMSGPRNTGTVVSGEAERGEYLPERSEIYFAVPSVQSLAKNKLNPVFPGVIENSIQTLSKCLKSKYVKIAVDGKKIARGKGKIAGDIDFWGYEPSHTLHEKSERYKIENIKIEELAKGLESFAEKNHTYIRRRHRHNSQCSKRFNSCFKLQDKKSQGCCRPFGLRVKEVHRSWR
ncbi:hypothetical protein DPMN_190538 [Dreissena polymorpha]|uniref:Uncharacterized protein n=1 Tax=Dreissena polymorpha TaxID=45954 RepID=A0A9D4DXG1_DREPO|nr:hypothetical protein DPMN_190538 [Dreissena polymorpha]